MPLFYCTADNATVQILSAFLALEETLGLLIALWRAGLQLKLTPKFEAFQNVSLCFEGCRSNY